jgi:predicted ArsR family transcriptional regulator
MKTACLAGLCACGAEGTIAAQTAADTNAQAAAPKPPTMPQKWILALLPQLAKADREEARRILKGCAEAHYEDLKMQATVDKFRGRMDEFLAFLRKEWGWIIDHDRNRGLIRVNENKTSCVCPLVPKNQTAGLGILCYCSEGFAEKMFSEVHGSRVRVEVAESILRGQKNCIYRIDLKPSAT